MGHVSFFTASLVSIMIRELLLDSLITLGVEPRKTMNGYVVSLRTGPKKRSATFDLDALIASLPAGDERAVAHSAARGIVAVINEPGNSKADAFDFIESTPIIAPAAEGPGFEQGVLAAGGTTPFFQDYVGDLRLAYYLDLDEGQRLLPASQVDAWGVHPERVEKAGLSMLYHRSGWWEDRWEKRVVDGNLVRRMTIGDGGDTARGTLLELFDYALAQKGRLFAIPTNGALLVTDDTSDDAYQALKTVVENAYGQSKEPLCPCIFICQDGHLRPTPFVA